ncbi:NmrA-like family protein [Byssothecium circinans]|uniref:NmrA-like family protein n=1 Tax=Byssothecium circinans TaxID=147558 RepID=A0A6A5U6D9_9PLEO|nr:NmrA-like family protein [Byssothecium circinans]
MELRRIFIIGGTGAQGLPVVESLVSDGRYNVRILTRDATSKRSQSLQALGKNVELVEGTFTNESDVRKGYSGCDAAFVNIDGFNTGEMAELYWAIRCYELAIEDGGIRFFVYGNLDYVYKESGYRPEFRTGHYDGKGRIGEWILFQAKSVAEKTGKSMGTALFTTGPYMEMSISVHTPMAPKVEKDENGNDVLTWRLPLEDGAVPHVSLEDCGPYVRWLFDNPERANGMDLQVSIAHLNYREIAEAFTKVTGKPARFINTDLDTYFREGPLSPVAERPSGYTASLENPATMRIKENFSGFWHVFRASGGNKGVIRRDYKLLDEIHPQRIRSAEEWFRREEEKGRKAGKGSLWDRVQPSQMQTILKLHEDGFRNPSATR